MLPKSGDLPEINYDDPSVKAWLNETEARWKKNRPTLTHEELLAEPLRRGIEFQKPRG